MYIVKRTSTWSSQSKAWNFCTCTFLTASHTLPGKVFCFALLILVLKHLHWMATGFVYIFSDCWLVQASMSLWNGFFFFFCCYCCVISVTLPSNFSRNLLLEVRHNSMLFPALNPLQTFSLSVEALLTEVKSFREGDCQVWEVLGLFVALVACHVRTHFMVICGSYILT